MSHDHDHHPPTDVLDLDAEIFGPSMSGVHEDIERAADAPVRSVLDLGAGTGTGTFGLLRHFTEARATAVDASPEMLTHLERQAERLGLSHRVTTLCADLDEGVPVVEPVDLAWAAASLHHLADPDRTLARLVSVIRPGGLLAVAELDGFPRFLPDDAPGAAVELRVRQLLAADRAEDMPAMDSDWGSRLSSAGLIVEQHRTISIDLTAPPPAVAGRYAAAVLTRVRGAVADRLDPADLAAFDALLDGGADDVRHRGDLRVKADRWLWIARRPR